MHDLVDANKGELNRKGDKSVENITPDDQKDYVAGEDCVDLKCDNDPKGDYSFQNTDSYTVADTIVAAATPPGQGGVGIVRLSGASAIKIAKKICNLTPRPRYAHFTDFLNSKLETIDQGILLYFKAPNSFTGEDVVELQGHGGPVIMSQLINACLQAGARQARAGEFSERAFLNQKMDLIQAEAIADLISAGSKQAAQAAMRSMTGAFSKQVQKLQQQITETRKWIEASIDFSDEEIDFMQLSEVFNKIKQSKYFLEKIIRQAENGLMLQNGLNVVLAGAPNSGKSTLINNLAADDVAIVTPLAGTTRDKLQANILLHGLPLQITDTAGLRETTEIIEQEGIIRSEKAMQEADLIIWLCNLDLDSFLDGDIKTTFNNEDINSLLETDWRRFVSWRQKLQCEDVPVFYVANKSDLHNDQVKSFIKNKLQSLSITDELRGEVKSKRSEIKTLLLSAKNNDGISSLEKSLVDFSGVATVDAAGGSMSARKRHVDALNNALARLNVASVFYTQKNTSLEIIAEEMRLAQISLSELTGEHTSDDLLGEIFSSFCVGK